MNPNSPHSRRSIWTLLAVAAVAIIGFLATGEIPTETIDALLGNEPVEQVQQAEPQAQIEPVESTDQTEPVEPAEQVEPVEPEPDAEQAEAPVAQPRYEPISDLPLVVYADLPPEAHDTITLVIRDGPFPYDKDGATFQNREGLLPPAERGYYREYTVETPGSPDRGARRIVGGADGERYYTADHYDSFREIVPEGMKP